MPNIISLKNKSEHLDIDHLLLSPFKEKCDYESSYFDKTDTQVIWMVVTKKHSIQLPRDFYLTTIVLYDSKTDAASIKYQLMPKDTNNFYPFRKSTRIVGYIMFAFQICGLSQ